MRKNDVRKWLHAVLDLLPLIIIPVFMVYSHRHTIDTQSVEISKNEVVDFNQLVQNGDFSDNIDYWSYTTGLTYTFNDGIIIVSTDDDIRARIYQNLTFDNSHKFLTSVYYKSDNSSSTLLSNSSGWDVVTSTTTWQRYQSINFGNGVEVNFAFGANLVIDTFYFKDIYVIDLTQMFGVGNEPTIQQFNALYPDDYYDYTLSDKQLLKDVSTDTLNDTDIGSQFVYTLYNSTHDYFNFNNVFGFENIYDWLQLNIFNGNAPISFFIAWQVILYEFLMDLIFLIYGVFMFLIDFCSRLMDRGLGGAR